MRPLTFCLEQTLGHRTHGQNLEAAINRRGVPARIIRVEQPRRERMKSPWALRGSASAWRFLRDRAPEGPVFFHTQTISLFAPFATGKRPYVVSVDATPVQLDSMGQWYRHAASPRVLESAKRACYRAVLGRATAVVAWSHWAEYSLRSDYGVAPQRITVAHPGAPDAMFRLARAEPDGITRILFVGADFERKGGPQLLQAFGQLQRSQTELVLVTPSLVSPQKDVRVVSDVVPGSDRLLNELARADIFCLPTRGDCTPVAIEEAMAAGLPIVTTTVGANSETVLDGETGLLVQPNDVHGLAQALARLLDDPAERLRMGAASRERALAMMHAEANADRILDLMMDLAR